MLAYILALVVGLSSVALYMAAFFFPEVHRKHDFLWSGLGMFYALVLWVCAGRITGGVLLGQTASVVLLGWMGWQTLSLRRQVAPIDQQTAIPSPAEWQAALSQAWAGLASSKSMRPIAQPIGRQVAKLIAWIEALVTTTTTPTPSPPPKVEPPSYVPLTPADFADAKREAVPPPKTITTDQTIVAEVVPGQTGSRVMPKEPLQPKQPKESLLSTIAKQAQNALKGRSVKRESKPVYVRKQFRTPEVSETEAQAAIGVSDAPVVSHANAEDLALKSSSPEGSEATIAEVDTTEAAVSQSSVNDAAPVSDPEQSV